MDYDRAISVNSEIGNTEISYVCKNHSHRNAYQVKLEKEYNPGTSVRHPSNRMKMYAELTRKESVRSRG